MTGMEESSWSRGPSHRREYPWHGKADPDGEHTEREDQVLLDRADYLAGDEEEMGQSGQVVREEADLGIFDCKIGPAAAHRHADVREGEGGTVVDTVANDGDSVARSPENRRTTSALSAGRTSACTSWMPGSLAIRSAVFWLSPVTRTVRMPIPAGA